MKKTKPFIERTKRKCKKTNVDKCQIKGNQYIFTKDDYNSGNGFSTFIWGSSMWIFLHTMSFNYPVEPTKEDKKHYMEFLKSLQYILPCRTCRENYTKNIKAKDTKLTVSVLKNRETLSRWLNKLHNTINNQLGKNKDVKYEDCRDFYEQFRARCSKPKKKGVHGGCYEPFHKGIKSRTILRIIPRTSKEPTLDVDEKCLCKKN
jgi:hypothetical protein